MLTVGLPKRWGGWLGGPGVLVSSAAVLEETLTAIDIYYTLTQL